MSKDCAAVFCAENDPVAVWAIAEVAKIVSRIRAGMIIRALRAIWALQTKSISDAGDRYNLEGEIVAAARRREFGLRL